MKFEFSHMTLNHAFEDLSITKDEKSPNKQVETEI